MSGPRLAFLLWMAALPSVGVAAPKEQESVAPAALAPPPFRRIYLPEEDIKKLGWSEGYIPIEAKEFEQLLSTVQAGAGGAPSAKATEIDKADYTAELVGDDLLVGTGLLRLVRRADRQSMLLLDPCSPALSAAVWPEQNSRPAVLGTAPDGRVCVLVDGTQLHFRWSLRGERTASGAVSFRLELPSGLMTRLTLDAPGGLDVVADRGIVSKSAGAKAQTNRWMIELGGHNRVNLRVVPEDAVRERRPLTLLRQALTYELSTRGLSVVAQLKLDVHGEPLQQIAMDLDPSLRLVAARYGELEIPWSATTPTPQAISHVVLQMPEPIDGTGRVLQLSAVAPMEVGTRWRLPGLRPQNMSWQEGTAELLIPNALVLEQLVTEGCRQSRTTALPAPATGESIEIQYYHPGANIDVLLAQPRDQLKIDSGTVVEVGVNEITSHCTVQLSVARGQRRAVQIAVASPWSIDAVANPESSRPLDWELVDASSNGTDMRIRFDRPVTVDNPTRVAIRGHRAPPTGSTFDAKQLEMLDLVPFQSGTRLISVRAAEGSELHWTGPEDLDRRDAVQLKPAELQLFPLPPNGLLFAEDAVFAQAAVGLERRKPSYRVDIRIDAAVQKKQLTETYTIQCVPEAARVERLLLRFSEAHEIPLEWNMAGGNSGQLSARRISAGEQAQVGLPAGGEVWEINVRLARPGPFELRAIRSIDFDGETPLALVSVADATVQLGRLAIRALGDSGLTITNRRLTSIPAELLEPDRYQTARATYRYQPSRDDLGTEPAVSIAPADALQAASGAWVWNHWIESRYAVDGPCAHRAAFHIQTAGQQQVRVWLPPDATLQAVWVDQQRLPLERTASDEGALSVDLPPGRSFSTLSLYYVTPGKLPGLVSNEAPAFPRLDIPIMARQWSVWLPPGYEILDSDSRFPNDSLAMPTWSQRLFGILGRRAGASVFNPLAFADWQAIFAGETANQLSRQASEQLAQNLGNFLGDYLNGEELTWGQLLALCSEAEAQAGRALLVDAESLTWLGLTAQARVRFQSGESALSRGLTLLKEAHLVLIVDSNVAVITSASGAANYDSQLSGPEASVMYTLSPGPLADELHSAQADESESRFASVETWRAAADSGQSPWSLPEIAGVHAQESRGWSSYGFYLSEDSSPRIRIVHRASMRSLAWALFLAIVGVGFWRVQQRPALLVLLVAFAASASLLLPVAYVPLANSALLAGLFCLARRMIRLPQPQDRPNDSSRGSHTKRGSAIRQVAILLFLATALSFAAAIAAAQPNPTRAPAAPDEATNPPRAASESTIAKSAPVQQPGQAAKAETPAAEAPIHRVFVPVDAQQKPVGEKYYLPEEFYTRLSRQAALVDDRPKGWLVTRGFYQGILSHDPASKRLGLLQLKATFDLQVLQSNVQVQLPFPHEAATNPVIGVRLDGRTIPPTWNAAGDELILGALGARQYNLELDLQPQSQSVATGPGIDLAIPPLTNATLELAIPPDGPSIELPTARGLIRVQKDRGVIRAELGACNRLAVRWPTGGGMDAAPPNLEVEELIWVKVRPGTTLIDAKLKYRVLAGHVRQVRLLADPRLRLLSSPNSQSPIVAVHTIPGDPQKIDLELSRDVSDQVEVNLSFLVTNTSGVGNLRLPRLESSGARPAKRWLAVSVDPALQPKIQTGEGSKSLDIADFAAAWGAADLRPQAAFGIPRGEPIWLATQPNEPQTTVEQTLALSLGRGSCLAQFDATLTITGGVLFQLALQGPPGMAIEQVSMLDDNVQRVARWSAEDNGQITIFLTAPINGQQQLSLRGHLDARQSETLALPQWKLLGAETKKNHLHLYRQPAVLVDVEKVPGISDIDFPEHRIADRFGALFGCYAIENGTTELKVKLVPNLPKSHAVAITYLQRDADRWMAEMEYHIDVLEGLVDALQFGIPPQWSEPYRIDPPMPSKVVTIPGETRRHLILYPEQPIHGKQQVKIRGRVALSVGGVPDILPLRVEQVERFVVLPQHLDLQQITWDTFGLSRGQLPAEFMAHGPNAQSLAVYQVAGEHFQASLKAVQRASAAANVKLADLHLIWQADGSCQGFASFDLEPGGATSCVLELPPNHRLLHVSMENLPGLVTSIGDNRWRLGLGAHQLPQRVEVIFTGPLAGSGNQRQLSAPRLVGLEVERTLWTVYGPPPFGFGQPPQPGSAISSVEQELYRLKNVTGLVQLPAETVGEHLPEEIALWYRPWKNRYTTARAAFHGELIAVRHNNAQSEEALEARELDKQVGVADARLGAALQQIPQSDGLTEFLAAARANLFRTHYMVPGQSHALDLRFSRTGYDHWTSRLLVGLAILLLGSASAFLLRDRPLPTFTPALATCGIGCVWWLFLTPSVIGLVASLAAAYSVFRVRWQRSVRPRPS